MNDASKKRIIKLSIVFFVFLLFSGALLIFLNSKPDEEIPNIVSDKEEESSQKITIKITEDLKISLRNIIPRLTDPNCANQYYYKQFNNSTFRESDFTEEDKMEVCENIPKVYHMEYKVETIDENVYLYDYILMSDGINFGTKYDELIVPSEKIEMITNEQDAVPSEESFKTYAKVYKYSFKYINNAYIYIDTMLYNK